MWIASAPDLSLLAHLHDYTLVDIKASLCDLVHHRARLARIDEA